MASVLGGEGLGGCTTAADESRGPEVPDVAFAGAPPWLTEAESDALTPMPSLYISGKSPSGLVSCPVMSTN